jgi:4-hydroxybenzoate polyprenyltransferase
MVTPYLEILRPNQWYKNLLIFIGIIFAGKVEDFSLYQLIFSGFLMLSLISGVNYIINDIVDMEKDKQHPEKRNRPLPSGRISKKAVIFYGGLLFIVSNIVSFRLNFFFGLSVLALFLTAQLYTFWLKNIIFADVIAIAIDFVWRAVSGAFIISVTASPWLIVCTFLLALFLAFCKRKGDMFLLGEKASNHREVLDHYTSEILNISIAITASTLILSYSMYSFQATHSGMMMVTIPVATFLVFRYLYLTYSNSPISRNAEKILFDRQFMVGMIIWFVMAFSILYI